jgi:broad specificity phosphatase PhoE
LTLDVGGRAESKKEVVARAWALVDGLVADALTASSSKEAEGSDEASATGVPGKEVLLVSHGGFIRVLLRDVCAILNIGEVSNTSISTIDVVLPEGFPKKNTKARVKYEIIKMNDLDHLGGRDGDLMSANRN